MTHRYDHRCRCEYCSDFEKQLKFKIEQDKLKELEEDLQRKRIKSYG